MKLVFSIDKQQINASIHTAFTNSVQTQWKFEIRMKRSNILAHRGLWRCEKDKNSLSALERALDNGFGVETDFRDMCGQLVISHDPPIGDVLLAETFFQSYSLCGVNHPIALNIKSDGLCQHISDTISSFNIPLGSVFAFDMSIPDSLAYLNSGVPTYARISEYEPLPDNLEKFSGIWIDNFTSNFNQVAAAKKIIVAGKRACLVSSELHRREFRTLWKQIYDAKLHENPLFEICTDLPLEAFQTFGEK